MKASKLLLIFIALVGVFSIGCKKISKAWVAGKVEVVDAVTGEPLEVAVGIEYHVLPLLGQAVEKTKSLGSTDQDGKLKFEYKVGRRSTGHQLTIAHPPFYAMAGQPNEWPVKTRRSLSAQGNNKIRVELEPWYPFQLRATNANCFDANDSLWVTFKFGPETWQEWTMTSVGCSDTIFDPPNLAYGATQHCATNQITFEVTTKKGGVTNSFSETHNLLPAQWVPITINY